MAEPIQAPDGIPPRPAWQAAVGVILYCTVWIGLGLALAAAITYASYT